MRQTNGGDDKWGLREIEREKMEKNVTLGKQVGPTANVTGAICEKPSSSTALMGYFYGFLKFNIYNIRFVNRRLYVQLLIVQWVT